MNLFILFFFSIYFSATALMVPGSELVPQTLTGVGRAFAPIGRLTTTEKVPLEVGPPSDRKKVYDTSTGSAFLISPCLVLTAYHVVFGTAEKPVTTGSARFYASDGSEAKASVVAWSADPKKHFALLRLEPDRCLGLKLGWIAPLTLEGEGTLRIDVVGYPDGGKQLMHITNCKIGFGNWPGFIEYKCSTRPGQSGSPIIVFKRRRAHFVGVHGGAYIDKKTGEVTNLGLRLSGILDDIDEEWSRDMKDHGDFDNRAFVPALDEGTEVGIENK